jgi:hypothetical protein
MAFKSHQIQVSSTVPTPLVVKGDGTGTTFTTVGGATGDPTPFMFKNTDASATVWVGGPDVSSGNGYPLSAGQSTPATLIEAGEIPYAIASVNLTVVAVLAMRQG